MISHKQLEIANDFSATLVTTPSPQEAAQYDALAAHMLYLAKQRGASAAEVSISTDAGFTLTVRKGLIETIEHHNNKNLDLTVFFGQRSAHIDVSDLTLPALNKALDFACHIAKYAEEDPFAGLPEESLLAFGFPELDLYHPWSLTIDEAFAITHACESAALSADQRIINSEGATLDTHSGYSVFANSQGFLGGQWGSHHSLSCSVVAQDDKGMQRDHDYSISRLAKNLLAPEIIGGNAAQKTVARLGARSLGTRKAPVIFHHEVAPSLFNHLFNAIAGSAQYHKSTFLLDKLHQQVLAKHMTCHEQPHIRTEIGSAPFDAEGVRTCERDIVKNGELQTYLLGSYYARKLGLQSTGHAGGIHHLHIRGEQQSYQELLKTMKQGLLVTELIGQGVNGVTGDYSRGAAGFWVEDGAIAYPVHEITLAGQLSDMLQNIVMLGDDIETRSRVNTGSLLIDQMTIAGQT